MTKHICDAPLGQINGRTLRSNCKERKLPYKKYPVNSWVDVCHLCDIELLKTARGGLLPFLLNGVMCTVEDVDVKHTFIGTTLFFGCFPMSLNALNGALSLIDYEDPTTLKVEKLGVSLRNMLIQNPQNPDAQNVAYDFSKKVCIWGRGARVWANLLRHNSEGELKNLLYLWLTNVVNNNEIDLLMAISQGIEIKGLGVSFASKHLRMIEPTIFPVLDAVLQEGLGIAVNSKGYQLFQSMLTTFKTQNSIEHNIAKLEAAIFWLVRQNVRSIL